MRESETCFHNLEWPAEGARLAGPVVWLRGWVVGKAGHDFGDVRVRHAGRTHLGILGLPRTDLAAHFGAPCSWLPAEFIVGVPAGDGDQALTVEVMDAFGRWQALQTVAVTVAPDGAPPPRVEGRVEEMPDGTCTVRDAHHPFHGHLDEPGPAPQVRLGRAPVFGWLLDETQPLTEVLATTDLQVFNHLEHSRIDDALAAKVRHPGAQRARLRGWVDCPATLVEPACLRVYAVSPGGRTTLCFAQRLRARAGAAARDRRGPEEPRSPTAAPVAASPGGAPEAAPSPEMCNVIRYTIQEAAGREFGRVVPRELPELRSGRPRRLLFFLRTLLPDDATLRALDLAARLTGSHRWALRVVSTEDGPLRADFERAGGESLIVNPAPLFAAANDEAARRALQALEREIRWDHLDAAVAFDASGGWALTLAQRRGIATMFDCVADERIQPDATAIPSVQALLRDGWRGSRAICFATAAAASAQAKELAGAAAQIIPQWHTPGIAPAAATDRIALAPLRAAEWLRRRHPEIAARWTLRQGPATGNEAERLARKDDALAGTGYQRVAGWSVDGIALCLGPLFGRGPLRPLLDAAAAGVPAVIPATATTTEYFRDTGLPFVGVDNPLALAHALLAADASPGYLQREAAAAREMIRARHDPAVLLARWEALLASVVSASSGRIPS